MSRQELLLQYIQNQRHVGREDLVGDHRGNTRASAVVNPYYHDDHAASMSSQETVNGGYLLVPVIADTVKCLGENQALGTPT